MKKIILILLNICLSQHLITDSNNNNLIMIEIESIKSNSISEELYITPYIEKVPSDLNHINILDKLDLKNFFVVEPVFALRASNSGFEMYTNSTNVDNSAVPSSVLWITPGVKIHSTVSILNDFKSIWIYTWSEFHKHSAYGFDDKNIYNNGNNLFNYIPEYSTSFYTGTVNPSEGGIDFDQSHGGISLLSSNFKVVFGKFKTSLGPSSRSNLTVSNNSPPFEQMFLNYKYKNITLTYLFGKLDSNIPIIYNDMDSLHVDQWEWNPIQSNTSNLPEYSRYIASHRIDINIYENLRIGFFEQVIFGGRDIPLSYLVPVLPFWSSQHEGGDLDNIMMGFDIDYIFSSNRIYFSLLLDEWAPYSTFDEDERNWFAYQFGYSRYIKLFNRDCIIKAEYTRIDPRAYNHRFIINEPTHHGYNIGYWSGRNSDDLSFNFLTILNNKSFAKISYEFTRFSSATPNEDIINLENQYADDDVDFLSFGYNSRKKVSFLYSRLLKQSIFCDLIVSSISTSGLPYFDENFKEIKVNFRYNISK